MPERQEQRPAARALWSGTLSFGLVSIPVDLVAATRSRGVALRMLDRRDGAPVRRRYYCPEDGEALEDGDIAEGYELEPGHFVVVTEKELESVEPRKSRDIELRRFVAVEQIDPMYVERTYFLLPSGQSSKAYHLLAETMERRRRAGLATFVMRDREYLAAIFAEGGLLRASTLRFSEELRSPDEIPVSAGAEPPPSRVRRFSEEIRAAAADELDPAELEDHYPARLRALVERKRARHEDVFESEPSVSEPADRNVVDLMQVLKERLGLSLPSERRRTAPRRGAAHRRSTPSEGRAQRPPARRAPARSSPKKKSKSSRAVRSRARS